MVLGAEMRNVLFLCAKSGDKGRSGVVCSKSHSRRIGSCLGGLFLLIFQLYESIHVILLNRVKSDKIAASQMKRSNYVFITDYYMKITC